MVIETKELGFVEVGDEDIITFPHAIYGFEEASRFVLLRDDTKPDNPFMWLQCVEEKTPCFIVADPHTFLPDYRPELTGDEKRELGIESDGDVRFLLIANVPKNIRELSLNLKCPVALNIARKTAMQVILENTDYPMRYFLFERVGG